jgi:hypothetical protein
MIVRVPYLELLFNDIYNTNNNTDVENDIPNPYFSSNFKKISNKLFEH